MASMVVTAYGCTTGGGEVGMTNQQAIDLLSHTYFPCGSDSGEAIAKAVEALKAQEPVRPVIEKNTSSGECEDPWGRLFFCGACGKRINEKYNPDEDDKYCKHCGRPVKWE